METTDLSIKETALQEQISEKRTQLSESVSYTHLSILLHIIFGINQIPVLFRIIEPKYSCGSLSAQAVYGFFQLLTRLQGSDLSLPAVIYDPDLVDIGHTGPASIMGRVPFFPAEHTPDTGNERNFIPRCV